MLIPKITTGQDLRLQVEKGNISLQLKHQHFLKHVEGTTQFEQYKAARVARNWPQQGILLINENEAQNIIHNFAGTGIIDSVVIDHNNKIAIKEKVDIGREIGIYCNKQGVGLTKTAMFVYGQKGAHLYPIKGALQ